MLQHPIGITGGFVLVPVGGEKYHVDIQTVTEHLYAVNFVEQRAQMCGVFVIFLESIGHIAQRNQSGCGQKTALPQAAAQNAARAARPPDQILRSGQNRTNRCAQSLGETAHHGIAVLRHLTHIGNAQNSRGVEQPCAVQMHGHALFVCGFIDCAHVIERDDRARGMGILHDHKRCGGHLHIAVIGQTVAHGIRVHGAVDALRGNGAIRLKAVRRSRLRARRYGSVGR